MAIVLNSGSHTVSILALLYESKSQKEPSDQLQSLLSSVGRPHLSVVVEATEELFLFF